MVTILDGQNPTINSANGGSLSNGSGPPSKLSLAYRPRPYPQETYAATSVEPNSFYGNLRRLYSNQVLKTQLEQMKKQGSYDAFKLQWHPAYDVRRLKGARTRTDGIPPSLFWESDVGKWIEGACYFLSSPDAPYCYHAADFDRSIQDLVDMIERAQQPDGYLGIYFVVVDPAGRFKNLRDMHEMYNAGHLLEGALAHYHYTKSRQFLDVMIRYIACLMKHFGPEDTQLHGYPGHPELELAVLRLHSLTSNPEHLKFAEYLLSARGVKRADQGGESYFIHEAFKRQDSTVAHTMDDVHDMSYNQSHLPLHDQGTILGHSVRALYLTTAAADIGGPFLEDAKRLWADAVDHKMYATGGLGTEPRIEGFSPWPYWLPQSTNQGGCYAETCASIACMMTCERILSHQVDGKVRDVMELCLLNAVLGGGSLNGKQFSYANKQTTCGDEAATRNDWFEVCCCPPNLSRTLGMLGGYTWASSVDESRSMIYVDIYLFVSGSRSIDLPDGRVANITMSTGMPWHGRTEISLQAPPSWTWNVRIPKPEYVANVEISCSSTEEALGFVTARVPAESSIKYNFSLPDTLIVSRGPIIYTIESVDNKSLDDARPHFEGVGISASAAFQEVEETIEGIPVIMLESTKGVYILEEIASKTAYREVNVEHTSRTWSGVEEGIRLVPWFARANRGGNGRVRTTLLRVELP